MPAPKTHTSTAYDWHGGLSSPLYRFASWQGEVFDEDHRKGLQQEIQQCLGWANAWITERLLKGESPAEYAQEPAKLVRLWAYVNKAKLKEQ